MKTSIMSWRLSRIGTTGDRLRITHIVTWICVFLSGASLAIGIITLALTILGFFAPKQISVQELQAELDKKSPPAGYVAEIETLRGQFAYLLDDERWSKAKDLFSGWVEGWSPDLKEKSLFIAEIRNVASNFPPERRSAAVDTFYRLKQEKRRDAALALQNSWYFQLGTMSSILVSLVIFGIFSLLLTLLRIEKNTRSTGSS